MKEQRWGKMGNKTKKGKGQQHGGGQSRQKTTFEKCPREKTGLRRQKKRKKTGFQAKKQRDWEKKIGNSAHNNSGDCT